MTQTVPATAVLGPGKTGLTIGLRVLNLDGTEYAAFSTTSVAETSTAGTYRKAGGVVAPLAGGYIVWGTALVDYAEATVESAAVNVTMQQGVAVAAADANGNVPVDVKTWKGEIPQSLTDNKTLRVDVEEWLGVPVDEIVPTVKAYVVDENGDLIGPLSLPLIRDAMKLAPSAGAAAAGSVDAKLDDILEDTGTTLPGLISDLPTASEIDTELSSTHGGGSWEGGGSGSYAGDGTGYYTDTIDDGTNPLDGVRVQLYTAQNRVGPAYEAYTNALGVFEMWPDPGTYYRWLDLAGFSFTQDVAVVVTEP